MKFFKYYIFRFKLFIQSFTILSCDTKNIQFNSLSLNIKSQFRLVKIRFSRLRTIGNYFAKVREFHSIAFKAVQSGGRSGWAKVSEGEGTNRKKVENIGNSYFPALVGSLFAPREGRGSYIRREYLARIRKYEETRPGNRRALLIR